MLRKILLLAAVASAAWLCVAASAPPTASGEPSASPARAKLGPAPQTPAPSALPSSELEPGLDPIAALLPMSGPQDQEEGDVPRVLDDPDGSSIAATAPTDEAPLPGPKLPDWFPIAPPLLAILIALLFRNVIPALFVGVWLGAAGLHGLDVAGVCLGLLDTFNVYCRAALADEDHATIVLFTLMIGGTVGIMMRNGGMQGVVDRIAGWASNSRRTQTGTAVLGLGIFFDDYANSLVVGNTMRSVTDRMRISREKLAYIVDSTAAPVACIAFVTTWIGAELGYIEEGLTKVMSAEQLEGANVYDLFLRSIGYSFYPILALFFVFLVAWTGRDFGPMLSAERRARSTGKTLRDGAKVDESAGEKGIQPKEGKSCRALNAILPILVMLITVVIGLGVTGSAEVLSMSEFVDRSAPLGEQAQGFWNYLRTLFTQDLETLRAIVGDSDSYTALMWGSVLGMLTAAFLSLIQGILSLGEVVDAWYNGMRSMMLAMVVLVLAWALSSVTGALDTAGYLNAQLGDSLQPEYVPAIVFGLAAATAFATGTSWGTMAILMPLVIPLTWNVLTGDQVDDPTASAIFISAIACVLAGAVWGDHCSPISDTTVLSSMASGCDHVDHVRTQLPYALIVGIVAVGAGTIPSAFGVPWYLCLPVGMALLVGVLLVLGRKSEHLVPSDEDEDELPPSERTTMRA